MKYIEIYEGINTPYAFEVYSIIEECIEDSENVSEFRLALEFQFTEYLRAKLRSMQDLSVRHDRLDVHIEDSPAEYAGVSGMFRCEDDSGETHIDGLPPLQKGTVAIYCFLDEGQLYSVFTKTSSWHEDAVKHVGATLIHEFVHAVQYMRSNKFGTLINYTQGIKRPNINGKRFGKRGGYDGSDYINGGNLQYYSSSVEIEAFAATASAEIVYRARKDADPKLHIEQILRSLRTMSDTIINYREMFQKYHLSLFGPKKDPRYEIQRKKVWKLFCLKLAKHLMNYLATEIE